VTVLSIFRWEGKLNYFGTAVTDPNFIHEEIKSRLLSGNACYHAVQNISSSV
jgi:hypothetical protein